MECSGLCKNNTNHTLKCPPVTNICSDTESIIKHICLNKLKYDVKKNHANMIS